MRNIPIDAMPGQGETMAALYGAGVRPAFIAAYTGRTANGVTGWLRRNGGYTSRRMSAEVREEIERLYYDGLSIEQIARAVGRSHGGVRYYLRSRDLYLPERVHVTAAMRGKIRRWYDRGVKTGVIADRVGVGASTIFKHVETRRRRAVSEEERGRMVAAYVAGGYVVDIARAMGRDHTTVRAVLAGAGVYEPYRQGQRVYRGWNNRIHKEF